MNPNPVFRAIEAALCGYLARSVVIQSHLPVGGGCINNAFCIDTGAGKFFCKVNDVKKYPGMFEAEAKGLQVLKEANEIFVPSFIASGEDKGSAFLILEFIEPGKRVPDFSPLFGQALARMHRRTEKYFGLDHDNYIGSLRQSNKKHDRWVDFFIEERLLPQIQLAGFSGLRAKRFENLFKKLDDIFPAEKPSLLHGDLWSGNYMVSPQGAACLIDPSVYYGCREMDIAMTKLFGGFDIEFYDAYNREFPLEPGWQKRTDLCNLYPLLVHVNLFGGSYLYQMDSIINRF
ncbi:MAG: fructosamine kinase family protein [Bacteroidetes bacterium]|nr:fructosamine kinase family protein [Bacteroidota bacterium]